MSTQPPPDRPTEPLRQPRPAPVAEQPAVRPAPVVAERVVASAVDPNVILLRLEDAIDGLRTWLLVVGLVAVGALGVATFALLDDDTARDAGGSATGLDSAERVSRIENRVDRLSRQVQDARGSGLDTTALANRVGELERTVRSLSGQPAADGTQQAVDELATRIDDLATDVEELKSTQP